MDKPKSKGDLRAAGKKRLEEFRQKKQQKGSSNKSSAIKALADDDKSLSGASVALGTSVTQQDIESPKISDGKGVNLAQDDNRAPVDSKLESQLLVGENPVEPEPLGESEAITTVESSSNRDLVTKSLTSDQSNGEKWENNGGETAECATDSKMSSAIIGSGQFLEGLSSNGITGESRLDNASSTSSNFQSEQTIHEDRVEGPTPVYRTPEALQETTERVFITEIEALKRQLQLLGEQKELVSNQLAVKAEQEVQGVRKVNSLIAEVESIQQDLNSAKNEKQQLVEEFTSSQKELQTSNGHLASELLASQAQVVAANQRASLLSEDLERAKQEVVEANAKFAAGMDSMQNLVKDREMRIAQLVDEMGSTQMLFQGLQDEKSSLSDALGRFENELHKYKEELVQKGNELDVSNQRIQTLQEDLASEKRALQQVQELLAEKSQLEEEDRVSNEKLEALILAKEAEVRIYGDQIRHLQSEKLGLVHQVEELTLHWEDARHREEGVCADLEGQRKAHEEQLKQLQDEKVVLFHELEKAKLLSKSLRDEKSSLTAAFDLQLEQLREDVRRREEEYSKQGSQLLESSQELQKLRDDHAQSVKEMEIALHECRTALDRESVAQSKAIQELMSARDQLLFLIEEKGQEVVNLGCQLEEHKDELRTKVEENSSLVVLLEKCRCELEETAKYASEYQAKLEKHRAVSEGLLEEKGTLAAEVMEIRAQYELMQQTATQHGLELETVRESLGSLEEDHSKLSSQSKMATDELTNLRRDKEGVDLELVANREQMTKLEQENSNMVKLLKDTQNELQRVREDNLLSSSDLASELDKHRGLHSELLIEKERLASELQLAIEQSQRFQQEVTQGKERIAELLELQKHLAELEEDHSKSLHALSVSQSEMSELKEENSCARLHLAECKEQLTKLEDENEDLVGVCARQREQLDAVLGEKETLLADHAVTLEKFREQQRDAEETKTKQTAQFQQLLMDLEELKNEKSEVVSELETYQLQCRELGDENWKVASEFNKCKDELEALMEEKTLADSTLEESKEMERKLKEGNTLLMTELEDQRLRQQNILEEKGNEIEVLEQQVKGLVSTEEQMARDLADTREHTQVLEAARLELLSNVEGLSKMFNIISEERDVLQSDLEASKAQLEELVREKQQLILKFEDALERWKVEKLQLSRDLETSLENQKVLATDKSQLGSEVAELTLKTHDLDAQRLQLAIEVGALKEMMDSSVEQRAHLASEVDAKEQLLQILAEEKNQIDSQVQIEREKATVSNDHRTQLTEELRTTKLRIEELESETAQLRVDIKYSQTQVELLTEERNKLTEEVLKHLSKGEQSQQLHEEIQGIRQVIASKDGQVDHLTTQCKLLQTELEVSNMEKRDLAQDLASLKHQLQQISEQKLHGVHELAQGVAIKQHALGNEEPKSESSLNVEKVVQDLPVLGDEEHDTAEDTEEPAHDVQSLHTLEEISKNLGQELRETLSLVGYVRLEFENQTEQLKKTVEELEGKQHKLDTTLVRVDELDHQVKELTEIAASLEAEKDFTLQTLYAVQEELRQSKNSMMEEKALLEDHLQVLEGTAAALKVERDDLAGKFETLEQSHSHLSERALQESNEKLSLQEAAAAFQVRVAEYDTELGNHKDMVAQSNILVQFLVQKVEDLICDAFPKAGQEVASSKFNKDTADYHNFLASRLNVEITAIRHELQDALVRLSETSKQLQEAEEQSVRLLKEREMAVETAEQTRSQFMKVAEEKQGLETALKSLEAIVSAENVKVDEQAITSASQRTEVEGLSLQIQSLNKQLENANAEKESLQGGLAQAEQKLSVSREKLSLAVNKGKAVVQQRDAWKLSLAEKSKELEMLVVGHQQELHDKDIALNNAERKIVDLTASLDHMARLEMQLDSFQKMISTIEQVFLENEDLFHSLCAVLENTFLPDDWRSSEVAKRILWITGCVSKLLQELATRREGVQALMEHTTALTSTVEKFEARVAALALDIDLVKHEKEELVLRLEDEGNQFQLERDQMTEEKGQLTGIIRQLDLDIAGEKRDKEDLATRLQAHAKEIVKLDAAVNTLLRYLKDCHEAISPVELDMISSQSSLDCCKYVVKLLVDNHNATVGKLNVALGEASLLSHPSKESVKEGLFQGFDDNTSSKEISGGLIEKVEAALASLEQQATMLVAEQNEKNGLRLELTRKEERLSTIREKLSAAVSKGKSLVQQRDSLKQALMEKDAELKALATAHKEELQSKELLLQEATDRLTSSWEHAARLEQDFVSFKSSVASIPDPSVVDRLSEVERQLSEAERRANAAESEAENSRNSAAVLLSDLELSQTRLDNLIEEVNSLTRDKNDLFQQLESAGNKYTLELQELTMERTQLVSEISNLKADLAMGQEKREKLAHDYTEVSANYGELRFQIEEHLTARATSLGEAETLQRRIAELQMALETEAQARIQLESETEAAAARIRKSTGEPVMERSIEPMSLIPHDQSSSQLDSLSASLVLKYEAALQEVQELSKQKASLSESQQTMMERERDMFEQLKQRVAAKDLELSELHKKIDSTREKEEDASKKSLEELGVLKEELAKARIERDTLQNELVQVEQKGATTREKLSLAIKKGKGVAQQRDLLKQSLSEQQSLVAHYKDDLHSKESALKKATDELSISEGKVRALELTVSTLRISTSTLEQELEDKDSLVKKLEVALTKWNFPNELQSMDITDKLEWLVAAVSNAESNLVRVGQERDALKKASAQLSSELADAQIIASREQESRLALSAKLEQTLGEFELSRNRIADLETLLAEAGGVGQETEQLTREILDLKRSVQLKQAEVDSAEEAVIAWVKRSEESEKYIQLCQGRIAELEQTVQERIGANQQIELLNDKISQLEEAVQQKEAAVKAMETSHGNAMNRLTLTTNKFRELYQQSKALVAELERMHKDLQDKDAEIVELKEEVAKIIRESQNSQTMLESKRAFQLHFEKLLETARLSGVNPAASSPTDEGENSEQLAGGNSDEERCIAHINLLRDHLSGLTIQSHSRQADVERKDVQLQGMRKELEEVVAERALLTTNLQREQIQSERLKVELASMQAPLTERVANQADEIEEMQVGKRLLPITVPTPHVRGARRPNSIDVAIDVESEMTQSLVEFDDKGHGFKSLASSRFMPRGTRAIGEQIDKLCVAGGRVLMRQPAARLMVTLYWLAIHIWMVFLISAAHI
ncbi:unnamed protein product [Calypogeia fissa]